MKKDDIDKEISYFKGTIYEIEDGEMKSPPVDHITISEESSGEEYVQAQCLHKGCSDKVVVSENGNHQYAWYYLTNKGSNYAGVTIKRWWVYKNQWRFDTERHRLYPGQHKEVFSFPRNQNPQCCIIACDFE